MIYEAYFASLLTGIATEVAGSKFVAGSSDGAAGSDLLIGSH
jgi:hypothetical protein